MNLKSRTGNGDRSRYYGTARGTVPAAAAALGGTVPVAGPSMFVAENKKPDLK